MKNQWLFFLCLAFSLPLLGQESETLTALNIVDVWKEAPDTWLQTVDGETIHAKGFQGKVIILNFWFIGCMPCMKELPYLNNLYEKFKDHEDVVFLSIAPHGEADIHKFIDPNDTTFQALRNYYKVPRDESPIKYPIVAICQEKEVVGRKSLGPDCHESLANIFGLEGYPLTLLIDRTGEVAAIRKGFPIDKVGKPRFLEEIESLLKR